MWQQSENWVFLAIHRAFCCCVVSSSCFYTAAGCVKLHGSEQLVQKVHKEAGKIASLVIPHPERSIAVIIVHGDHHSHLFIFAMYVRRKYEQQVQCEQYCHDHVAAFL